MFFLLKNDMCKIQIDKKVWKATYQKANVSFPWMVRMVFIYTFISYVLTFFFNEHVLLIYILYTYILFIHFKTFQVLYFPKMRMVQPWSEQPQGIVSSASLHKGCWFPSATVLQKGFVHPPGRAFLRVSEGEDLVFVMAFLPTLLQR